MTAGRGMVSRSLRTAGPSASTISALRSITSRNARRTGTMVSGSNEALSARQRTDPPRGRKDGRPARRASETAPYATQPAKARQGLGLRLRAAPERGLQRRQRPGERRVEGGRHGLGHAIEGDARTLGLAHQPAHDRVALAERDPGLDQAIG